MSPSTSDSLRPGDTHPIRFVRVAMGIGAVTMLKDTLDVEYAFSVPGGADLLPLLILGLILVAGISVLPRAGLTIGSPADSASDAAFDGAATRP